MFKKIKLSAALSTIALAFFAPLSSATVVDFTGLINGTNYTENGMVMASTVVKRWNGLDIAHMGKDNGVAIFKLLSNNDFNLSSVDMYSAEKDMGNGPAKFEAYNNGVYKGFANVNGNAGTYSFDRVFNGIDEFRISVFNNKSFTFDNINFGPATIASDLNTVPEPSTLALVGLSLAGLALARKRKSA